MTTSEILYILVVEDENGNPYVDGVYRDYDRAMLRSEELTATVIAGNARGLWFLEGVEK